jgi:Bacterial Ig domain/Putative flagellar system-associated repeat/Putative peptidoglycan binding domain
MDIYRKKEKFLILKSKLDLLNPSYLFRRVSALLVVAVTVFSIGATLLFPKTVFAVVLSSCQTISQSGTYTLSANIGIGGNCINIQSANVIIDGAGFTITGNIDASGGQFGAGQNGYSISLQNITVTGEVNTSGSQGVAGNDGSGAGAGGGNGATGGNAGNVTLTNASVGSINASGGTGGPGGAGQTGQTGSSGDGSPGISGADGADCDPNMFCNGGDGSLGGDGGDASSGGDGGSGGSGGQGGDGGVGGIIYLSVTSTTGSYIVNGGAGAAPGIVGSGGSGGSANGGAGGSGGAGGDPGCDYSDPENPICGVAGNSGGTGQPGQSGTAGQQGASGGDGGYGTSGESGSFSQEADVTPPTGVSITDPVSGTAVGSNSISITATASDDVGVTGMQFQIKTQEGDSFEDLQAEDTSSPFSIVWDPSGYVGGIYFFRAFARDAAMNVSSESFPISVTIDHTSPTISTAVINGNTITITYNEALNPSSVPDPGNFVVSGTASLTVTDVSVVGSTVTLTTESPAIYGDVYVLAYTGGEYPIRDLYGNNVENIGEQGLDNQTPAPDTTAPTISSITINANTLTITYNEFLDPASITLANSFALVINGYTVGEGTYLSTVSITGTTTDVVITHNAPISSIDTIALNYVFVNGSGNVPIQDLAGNDAENVNAVYVINQSPDITPPSITDVTSSPTSGFKKAGDDITVFFAFSEPVTATTTMSIEFDSGGDCTIPDTNLSYVTSASCVYTVGSGQTTADLNVSAIVGAFVDNTGNFLVNPTPLSNLAINSDIIVDTTLPTVSLTSPSNSSIIAGSSVSVTANASDTSDITNVQFKVDNVTVNTDNTSAYEFTFDSTSKNDGSHTLSVVALDNAGNIATSSVTVTIDNTAPAISNIASTTSATTATVTWDTNESSNSKVSYGTVTGTYTTASTSSTFATSPHTIGLTGLSSFTQYYYVVVSVDSSGNTSTSTEKTLKTIDITAPTVSLDSPLNSATVAGSAVSLTATATDNDFVTNVKFKIDGATITTDTTNPYSTTWDLTSVSDGTHVITAVAMDLTGNIATSTAATVIVDNTAPTISEVTPISTGTDTTPDYTFTTNEAGTITYGGSCTSGTTSASSGSNTVTFNTLSAGTYTNCTITVTDASGNVSSTLTLTSFTISAVVSDPEPEPTETHSVSGSSPSRTKTILNNTNPNTNPTPQAPECSGGTLFSSMTGKPCSKSTNNTPTPPQTFKFTKNILTVGVSSEEVRQLQIFLNNNGFSVSITGAGSKGKETRYFGPATKTALAKFQKAKNILPAFGNFGPKTREYVNGL